MSRLPKVNGDDGNWGSVLNDFLSQAHAPDGTLNTNTIGAPQLKQNAVTSAAIAPGAVNAAALGTNAVTTSAIADGSIPSAKLSDKGQANGLASLDSNGNLVTANGAVAVTGATLDSETAALLQSGSSAVATTLKSTYIPKWQANTAYPAGQVVLNLTGDTVTANVAFTSGASYDPTKWNLSSSYVNRPIGIVDGQIPVWQASSSQFIPGNGGGSTSYSPAMVPLANISKAKTGPFRVLHVGTSIADGVDSAGHMLGEQLKAVYGDSGLAQYNLSLLGGTTANVWKGWNKQPYGGHGLTRIRGNSASTALTFNGYFDTAVLEWSQESDSVPVEVVIDGVSQGFIGTSGAQQYNKVATFPLTLGVPTLTLGTTNTTGGTFTAGAYYWKITAFNSVGETIASNEVTATLVATGTQVLTIGGVNAAAGYNVYRGTVAGAENLLVASVAGQATTTFTDTGAAGTTASFPTTGTVPALGLHTLVIKSPVSGTGYAYLEWLELQNSARTGVEIRSASLGGSSISDMTNVHNPVTNQVAGIPIVGNNGLDAFFNSTDFDLIVVQDVVNDAGAGVAWCQGGYQTSMNYGVGTTHANNVPVISIIEMGGHYSIPNDNGSSTNNTAFNTIRNYQLGLRTNNHWTIIDWHGATILADLNTYMLRYYAATNLNVAAGTFTGDFTHPTIVGNRVSQTMVTAACGIPTPAQSSVLAVTMDRMRVITPGVGLSATSTTDGTAKQYPAPAGFAFQGIGPGLSSAFQGRPVPYYLDTAAINRADQIGIKTDIAASSARTAFGRYRDYTLKAISLGAFVNWAAGQQVMYTIKGSGTITLRVDSPVRFYIDGVQLNDATQSNLIYTTSGTQPVVVSFVVGSTANNGNTYVSGRIYSVAVTNSTVPLLTS